MSEIASDGGRAADLRRAFDRSFAEPAGTAATETIDFVAVRLGGDLHAVRMSEIAGLFADVSVTPCPGPLAELTGIAGFRGVLTPIYDLAALLAYAPSGGRWVMLSADRAIGFALDHFEGHFRIDPSALAAQQAQPGARHIHQVARHGGVTAPVVDLPSVVAAVRARAAASAYKEH